MSNILLLIFESDRQNDKIDIIKKNNLAHLVPSLERLKWYIEMVLVTFVLIFVSLSVYIIIYGQVCQNSCGIKGLPRRIAPVAGRR